MTSHVFSSSEKKRRQIYRGEVHGQLPFDTKVVDESAPSIDFSPSGSLDSEYSIERTDIDGIMSLNTQIFLVSSLVDFMKSLDGIVQNMASDPKYVKETYESLVKLIARMDGLESTFDRFVERSCECKIQCTVGKA